MEGPEKLDGLQVSPAQVPRFQAYLRQQLAFEHQRRRLRRSQRAWMCTAVVALLGIGFGFAQPRPFVRAHYALFSGHVPGAGPEYVLGTEGRVSHELVSGGGSLAQTVAASLARDSELAAQFGGREIRRRAVLPERAYVVSKYPLPDGREVQIYTSLLPEQDEIVTNAAGTFEGGAW
jgi:hypothetical protein